MNNDQRCENCRFWRHDPIHDKAQLPPSTKDGTCHRHAPSKGIYFPHTGNMDFCGEFESQEPKQQSVEFPARFFQAGYEFMRKIMVEYSQSIQSEKKP